jgi:hypothetical protein
LVKGTFWKVAFLLGFFGGYCGVGFLSGLSKGTLFGRYFLGAVLGSGFLALGDLFVIVKL